jgi:hypothetical protein
MPLLPGLIAPLFETEENATRFERVCLELYERAEGVTLVPTSRTYDLGRDARQISLGGAAIPGVLCASLSIGVDDKVERDLTRLENTTTTTSVVFCSARKLTEQACDRVEADIRNLYPIAESVRVLGQAQLVKLAMDHEDILYRHYLGEITDLERFIRGPVQPQPATLGLRLALSTHVGEDASELRSEVGGRLVLDQLRSGTSLTITAIATQISQALRLSRSLSNDVVTPLVAGLEQKGFVARSGASVSMSKEGKAFLATAPDAASVKLLEGRVAVRDSIARLTGGNMSDVTFAKFWEVFQDAISQAFYDHGVTLINMVASITSGEAPSKHIEQIALMDRLADRTSAMFDNPQQHDELRQAVIDMFSAPDDPAFEWLTSVCSVYVMMCSLGLESRSAREITDALSGMRLVPDTDILLSLLCEAEDNHQAAVRVVRGWQALGGSIAVGTPTLEEVAVHAFIADFDYTSTKHLFGKLNDMDAMRVISNAFVRTFYKLAGGAANDRDWWRFIEQYRSADEEDYSRILQILTEEFGVTRLADYVDALDSGDPKSFGSRVSSFLRERQAEEQAKETHELDKRTLDKTRRDALLLANLKAARESFRQSGDGRTAVILSSAHLLREAGGRFKKEFQEPDAVVPLAAVAALLALVPGVNLGLKSLRAILFDTGFSHRLGHVHRFAYRVVVASNIYELPYSRRVTMKRKLREGLLASAKKSGKHVAVIEKRFTEPDHAAESAELIKGVLDGMAIEPKTRELMKEQQTQIESLQAEIIRLKELQIEGTEKG